MRLLQGCGIDIFCLPRSPSVPLVNFRRRDQISSCTHEYLVSVCRRLPGPFRLPCVNALLLLAKCSLSAYRRPAGLGGSVGLSFAIVWCPVRIPSVVITWLAAFQSLRLPPRHPLEKSSLKASWHAVAYHPYNTIPGYLRLPSKCVVSTTQTVLVSASLDQ